MKGPVFMKMVLINMGIRSLEDCAALPPLGIMSIAGYLRTRMDVDIHLLNQRLSNASVKEMVAQILQINPDVVGVGGGTNNALAMSELVAGIREVLPRALRLIGGPHVSALGSSMALEQIDAHVAVAGEGEFVVELILKNYFMGKDFSDIPGIAWRLPEGVIKLNEGTVPIVNDLDTMPFYSYDLIDIRKYWKLESMGISSPIPYAVLSTSRGCPYHCNYCHRIHGKRYRAQSPVRIVDEISHLVDTYQIKQIEFVDDVFNLQSERVLEFCRLMVERKLNIKFGFPNGVRSDLLTEEIIDALVSAGMNFCTFALESGSPRIQKVCGKNLDIDKLLKAVELTVQRRVFTRAFAILGHPTETAEEIEETIRATCNSQLHTCLFFTATPFPGTEIHRIALEKFPQRLDIAFENANYHTIKANLSEVSDEYLRTATQKAYRHFYSSPQRVYRIIRDIPNYRRLLWGAYHVGTRLALSFIQK